MAFDTRPIQAALTAYRSVRFIPEPGGSLAYFMEKEARRADVLAAVVDARGERAASGRSAAA